MITLDGLAGGQLVDWANDRQESLENRYRLIADYPLQYNRNPEYAATAIIQVIYQLACTHDHEGTCRTLEALMRDHRLEPIVRPWRSSLDDDRSGKRLQEQLIEIVAGFYKDADKYDYVFRFVRFPLGKKPDFYRDTLDADSAHFIREWKKEQKHKKQANRK